MHDSQNAIHFVQVNGLRLISNTLANFRANQ